MSKNNLRHRLDVVLEQLFNKEQHASFLPKYEIEKKLLRESGYIVIIESNYKLTLKGNLLWLEDRGFVGKRKKEVLFSSLTFISALSAFTALIISIISILKAYN